MSSSAQQNRPNILVIMTDQQRRETVGVHPNAWIPTPNIDSLAQAGTNFTRAYAECPICIPTRVSFLNGKHAHEVELEGFGSALDNGGTILSDENTLPKLLQQAGYYTAIIGKTHITPYGVELGFDHSQLLENSDSDKVAYANYLTDNNFTRDDYWHDSSYTGTRAYESRIPLEHFGDSWVGRNTVDFINAQAESDKPFFLWSSYYKPHNPYNPPTPYYGRIDPNCIPAPSVSKDEAKEKGQVYEERKQFYLSKSGAWTPSMIETQEARARYCECVLLIDDQVGETIKALKDTGQWENTAIIFVSDHGDMLGDHGLWHKSQAYESSAGVPLILKAPEVPANRHSDTFASTIDLMPTCLDLAGLKIPENLDGLSLTQLAQSDGNHLRNELYLECCNRESAWHAIVSDHWKYVHYYNGGEEELYDLDNDPNELFNLAKKPQYLEQKSIIRGKLLKLIQKQGPQWAVEGNDFAECEFTPENCRYTTSRQ